MHSVPSTKMNSPSRNHRDEGNTSRAALASTAASESTVDVVNSDNESDYAAPSPRKLFDVAGQSRVSFR
jgi:hypothetical protein